MVLLSIAIANCWLVAFNHLYPFLYYVSKYQMRNLDITVMKQEAKNSLNENHRWAELVGASLVSYVWSIVG